MKCINKLTAIGLAVCMTFMCGCGGSQYDMAYSSVTGVSGFDVTAGRESGKADSFASTLCITSADIDSESVDMSGAEAALLCDLNNTEVLYAKNAHERLYPASLTKIMTALVALEHGSLDQTLTATDAVKINVSGAQVLGLKTGDTMTLNQALHFLLLYSANDVANLIAENIGGTVDDFIAMMNEKAQTLGATNTHFVNAHGLSDEEHYATPYDLYLIFNAALKYEAFSEIIQTSSYETTYYDKNGAEVKKSISTTNLFLRGDVSAPANVNVIGGKTGTTAAAGHCLILLARDNSGNPYIAVIMRTDDSDTLYTEMSDLLGEINTK